MINSVVLMGRLTYEPELRSTANGLSVITFQIACDRNYAKPNENRQTDFIDITVWRNTAEFVSRYFHKGDMIALEGSIQTDSYTDKDGNRRKSVMVVASSVSFCGSRQQDNAYNPAFAPPADNSDIKEITDDDLPF